MPILWMPWAHRKHPDGTDRRRSPGHQRAGAAARQLGAGPARRQDGAPTLHIDVIDPYPAGPGHVWQPGQSRLYLMNTQSFYPTVVPEDPQLAAAGGRAYVRPLAGTAAAGIPSRR